MAATRTESGEIRERCVAALEAEAENRGMTMLELMRAEDISQRCILTAYSISAAKVLQISDVTGESLEWLMRGE